MKTDSLSTALNTIIDRKMTKNLSTAVTNSNIYSYLDKEISIGKSEDGLAMVFLDDELTKMAIGIIDDKDGIAIPLLALGAGSGNGSNRGYISKGTDGLEMYYVGDLAAGEIGGLKLTKDGIFATHQIVVDEGLAGEFTIDATYWNEKLSELEIQQIVENPATGWDIAENNLDGVATTKWNDNVTLTGTIYEALYITKLNQNFIQDAALDASKYNTKQIVLASDTWYDNNPYSGYVSWNSHYLYYGGTEYYINASSTSSKYIYWRHGGTSYNTNNTLPTLDDDDFIICINNDGIHDIAWYSRIARQFIGSAFIADAAIKNAHIEDATITSAKIATLDAEKITAGTLTGFIIQTTSDSGAKRIVLNANDGFTQYDIYGRKRMNIPLSASGGMINFYIRNEWRFSVGEDGGDFHIRPENGGNIYLGHYSFPHASIYFKGYTNFSDCTIIGSKKVLVQSYAPSVDANAIWVQIP